MEQTTQRLAWTKLKCTDTGKRARHTSTLYKHYIVIFGGNDGSENRNDVVVFDTESLLWGCAITSSQELSFLKNHTACLFQDCKLIIFGGEASGGIVSNEVLILDIDDEREFTIRASVQKTYNSETVGRARHSAILYKHCMYVFGGCDMQNKRTNDLWQLSLDSFVWTLYKPSGDLPEQCSSHSAIVDEDKMYVFGGVSGEQATNNLHILHLETFTWQKVVLAGNACPCPRYLSAMCRGEGVNIYLSGGNKNKEHLSDLWCYDKSRTKDSKLISTPDFSHLVLRTLFNNRCFSDIIFQIEGQEVSAHKNILATRSKFFQNMFSSGMNEAYATKIPISDIRGQAFNTILEYIYCGDVKLNENLAWELLEVSEKFMLAELQKMCEEYLSETLNLDNFIDAAKRIDQLDVRYLRESISKFIISNLTEIRKNVGLSGIPYELLIDTLYIQGSS